MWTTLNNMNSTYTFSMSSISWKLFIHFLKKGQKFPSRYKIITPSWDFPAGEKGSLFISSQFFSLPVMKTNIVVLKKAVFYQSYLQWWKAMFWPCNELLPCTPHLLCLLWVWVTTFLAPCLYNPTSCSSYTLRPWRWGQHVPLKHWYLPTKLYNVATQETIIWRTTTVKTSKLIKLEVVISCFSF
jgi:hypothetical protein